MAQRTINVVLDSVRRLMRIGATANLVNLLQKQHPAGRIMNPKVFALSEDMTAGEASRTDRSMDRPR